MYKLAASTNKEDTQEFVLLIKDALTEAGVDSTKVWLLFDQASAHMCKPTQAVIKAHFKCLPQVYSSCQFNSVETLFAALKKRFRKELITRDVKSRDELEDLVLEILYEFREQKSVANICNANRPFICEQLSDVVAKRRSQDTIVSTVQELSEVEESKSV